VPPHEPSETGEIRCRFSARLTLLSCHRLVCQGCAVGQRNGSPSKRRWLRDSALSLVALAARRVFLDSQTQESGADRGTLEIPKVPGPLFMTPDFGTLLWACESPPSLFAWRQAYPGGRHHFVRAVLPELGLHSGSRPHADRRIRCTQAPRMRSLHMCNPKSSQNLSFRSLLAHNPQPVAKRGNPAEEASPLGPWFASPGGAEPICGLANVTNHTALKIEPLVMTTASVVASAGLGVQVRALGTNLPYLVLPHSPSVVYRNRVCRRRRSPTKATASSPGPGQYGRLASSPSTSEHRRYRQSHLQHPARADGPLVGGRGSGKKSVRAPC
jgi:hypothetical protein